MSAASTFSDIVRHGNPNLADTEEPNMLSSETVLQQRYRIVRQLGQGGMGAVYEALDERLHRTVALKETLVETEELRRAFAREARLLANLNHPALPKVIDHFSEDAGQYLVMEYIAGADLARQLTERGQPFPIETVTRWADELLDALEYLHGNEPPIIHRDIKPANLKLSPQGRIILLDFGLAKGTAGQMTRAQASVSVLGYTPNYAALEQIQGERTGPRSDLYSLAATLYHLLTVETPVDALKRATETFHDEADPLRPIVELNPQVPRALADVLMQALALRPSQRYDNAAELRTALRLARMPISSLAETLTDAPLTQQGAQTPATVAPVTPDNATALSPQALERETILLPAPPVQTAPPAPTTPQGGETVTVAAPSTQTRRRWPLYAAPLVLLLLAAVGLVAYQMRQRAATVAPAPVNDNSTTQGNQPPPPAQTEQPVAEHTQPTPHPTATQARTKPTPETNAAEEARKAEQQRAEQERVHPPEPEVAPNPPAFTSPEQEGARAAAQAQREAQLEAARIDFERARIEAANAQRDLQRTRQMYKNGQADSAAVDAATQRMYQTSMALARANARLQSLRTMTHPPQPNNLPRRLRRRDMNGQQPPP